ncbi:unnamed protein product [Peronospora belbahrii]|uniref:Uncharacterized protein n=1 Tax=Peronospora belbahrii TaxID=622444 RepID=A0ABN8CSY1_9STRA|nr:unnamed protein product [Peronospora belbahrii]
MSRNNKAAEEPRRQIQQLIGPLLHPTPPDQKVEQQQLLQALTSLNSGDKMDDAGGMVAENPWILDQQASVLSAGKYAKMRPGAIADLQEKWVGLEAYSCITPTIGATSQ